MTRDETNKTLTYDAWGRVVRVQNGSTHNYAYDALNRRTVDQNATVKQFYYSDQWQILEERHNASTSAKMQYLWSPVYVDAMILRDRDANNSSGDGLEERLYVQQDANWNVTAIVSTTGTVQERYVYEPYGTPSFYDVNWNALGSSAKDWRNLHQGGRYEAATGYYHFRNRKLSPALGRWNRQDPMGFDAGDSNLYRFVKNNPIAATDPSGLIQWIKEQIEYKTRDGQKLTGTLTVYSDKKTAIEFLFESTGDDLQCDVNFLQFSRRSVYKDGKEIKFKKGDPSNGYTSYEDSRPFVHFFGERFHVDTTSKDVNNPYYPVTPENRTKKICQNIRPTE